MTTRDIKSNVSPAMGLVPAVRTATATGNAVDLQGFGSAMVTVQFGSYTDGTHTPSVQHSADNVTYVTCDANSLSGTLNAISSGAGANTLQKVGYTGGYRYLRAVMTVTGATSGAASGMLVLRAQGAQKPV